LTAPDSAPATPPAGKSRWRRWAGDAAIILAVFLGVQLWQSRAVPDGPAPDIQGRHLDGTPFHLANWQAAHPDQAVLLYFWAEWCPVCKTTAGNLSAVAGDWPVTSIAIQSGGPDEVAATMRRRGYAWPTLADPDGQLLGRYGLNGVPAMVIIGPDGRIRFSTLGYTSELGLRLRLWWASRKNT